MNALRRHWARIAITLLPVVLALMHAGGLWRSPFLDALDYFIYDARLRATMPRTLDPRIVIVDVDVDDDDDDASLHQPGQCPGTVTSWHG
jgi:adenylate cyclase